MKQQNLFGQTIAEDSDKGVGVKGKRKPTEKEKTKTGPKKKSESPLPGAAADGSIPEPQDEQMDDDSQATTILDSQVQEVETQFEETQLNGSSPLADTEAETQPTTETQTEEEQTQPETPVGGDDGEPVSRLTGEPNSQAENRNCFWSDCRLASHATTGDVSGTIVPLGTWRWLRHAPFFPDRVFGLRYVSSCACDNNLQLLYKYETCV